MTSFVHLHPKQPGNESTCQNPLPQLVHTPSGLALLELQGIINLPQAGENSEHVAPEVDVGRIVFPDYHPDTQDPSSTAWMKQIHLYVGEHQRLTGEVKKLPKAMAIIKKRETSGEDIDMSDEPSGSTTEHLEVVEIVKYKLVFSQRPEPVGILATG
ncbi:hypothetical protein F4819DRAFT_443785 [Hypoxylon fuscum]|nr:hypothetical protein F4819DRAFT_443785 [Hypoxylon fuscum]